MPRAINKLLLIGLCLVTLGAMAFWNKPRAEEPRSFSDDDVILLLFDHARTHQKWPPRDNSQSFVLSSEGALGDIRADFDGLIQQITKITGVQFEELNLSDVSQAHIGMFGEKYGNEQEFRDWKNTGRLFSDAVLFDGEGFENSILYPVIVGGATAMDKLLTQNGKSERPSTPNEYERHLGLPACRVPWVYRAFRGQRAVAHYAHMGLGSGKSEKLRCSVMPFLLVAGLRGTPRFQGSDLIDLTVAEEGRGARLSPLTKCALNILFHPSMNDAGKPLNPAPAKAREMLANEGVCR